MELKWSEHLISKQRHSRRFLQQSWTISFSSRTRYGGTTSITDRFRPVRSRSPWWMRMKATAPCTTRPYTRSRTNANKVALQRQRSTNMKTHKTLLMALILALSVITIGCATAPPSPPVAQPVPTQSPYQGISQSAADAICAQYFPQGTIVGINPSHQSRVPCDNAKSISSVIKPVQDVQCACLPLGLSYGCDSLPVGASYPMGSGGQIIEL